MKHGGSKDMAFAAYINVLIIDYTHGYGML